MNRLSFAGSLCALVLAGLLFAGCARGGAGVKAQADRPAAVKAAEAPVGKAPPQADVAAGESSPAQTGDPFADDPFAEEANRSCGFSDPFEPVNRGIFWFNDKFYFHALKPVVRGYRFFVHEDIREGVANFFSNLATPVHIANDLLQLNGGDAARSGFRFAVNTTVGLLGIIDVAGKYADVGAKSEDMGQTLGSYGMNHGAYIVLPVVGPSSMRDGLGTLGDLPFSPLYYADMSLMEEVAVMTADKVNEFSLDKDTYESLVRQSLDPYLTIRDVYMQRRCSQVER